MSACCALAAVSPVRANAARTRASSVSGIRAKRSVLARVYPDLGQGIDRAGVPMVDVEHRQQRRFVTLLEELSDGRLGWAGQQAVDELSDRRFGLGAEEVIDDLGALHGVDGRDRLDPEGGRRLRILVDVDLHQGDLRYVVALVGLGNGRFDDGAKSATRAAPRGPEIDHHGHRGRTLDDFGLERFVGYIQNHVLRVAGWPGRRCASRFLPRARRKGCR